MTTAAEVYNHKAFLIGISADTPAASKVRNFTEGATFLYRPPFRTRARRLRTNSSKTGI
jgi:hypothetical protein